MKILPLSNSNFYQNKSLKNLRQSENPVDTENKEFLPMSYNDLAFKAKMSTLVKPKFETQIMEKLSKKITAYLKFLPEASKMKTSLILETEDKIAEFLMDKTDKMGCTDVTVKMHEMDAYITTLNMRINKKGQVEGAVYYEPSGIRTIFERTKTGRVIKYGDASYHPVGDNDNLWVRNLAHKGETFSFFAPKRMEFNDTGLLAMFSEMTKKNTSFLADNE